MKYCAAGLFDRAVFHACAIWMIGAGLVPAEAEPITRAKQDAQPRIAQNVTEQPQTAPANEGAPPAEAVPEDAGAPAQSAVQDQSASDAQLPEIKVEPSAKPKPKQAAAQPRARPAPPAYAPAPPAPSTPPGQPSDTLESTAPPPTGTIGAPPPAYAGGQVAIGGQVGLLGNRNVFDTPYSMTSYTAQTIEDQQATTIGDILENNPSVRAVSAGAMWDTFVVRGFEVSSSGYSLNGLPGIAPGSMVSPEFIDRVELFLGPSGMLSNMPLYGATGGAVNLVTKKANDKPLTALTTGYLADGQSATHLDVGRRWGLNKEWGLRVNGVYRNGATALDNQEEMLGLATAALDYHGKRVRTSLDIGYQVQNWNAPNIFLTYNGPAGPAPKPPKAGSNPIPPWTFSDTDDFFVAWQGEVDIAKNVTLFAAAGRLDNNAFFLSPYQEIEDRAGNTTVYPYFQPQTLDNFSANAGLRTNFRTGPLKHALRMGWQTQLAETGWYDTYYDGFASNIYSPVNGRRPDITGLWRTPPTTAEFNVTSLAIADTLSILDEAIQFTLGVRRQRIASESFDQYTGDLTSAYDESADTPTYGIVVKPWKKLSLYGNYIEGLAEGPIAPAGTVNAGQVFPPFVSTQYEAGAKLDFGSLGLTVAAFEITEPSAFIDAATNIFVVDGVQRNRGLEFNTFGELTKGLRVLGGVTLLEALLLNTGTGNDGNTAPGSPEVQVSFGPELDVPWIRGLTLTGRVLYSSSQFYDPANTITLSDWTTFDLGARYETVMLGRDMTFRALVENVADTSYWASAAQSTLTLGKPRRFLLSGTAKF